MCLEGPDVKGDDFDWLAVVASLDTIRGFGWDLGELAGAHGWGRCDDFGLVAVPVGFLCHRFNLDYLGFVFLSTAAAAADLGVYESKYVGQDLPDIGQTEQHEGNPQHGIGYTHQAPPESFGRDVSVPCKDNRLKIKAGYSEARFVMFIIQ